MEILYGQTDMHLLGRTNAAVFVEVIIRIILPLIGKPLKLIAPDGAKALDADDVITAWRETLKQNVAVLIGEIIFSGLSHLSGKMHASLVVDIEKLQHGNERGLADIIGTDQVQRIDQFDLPIVIFPCSKQDQARWTYDVHEACSSVCEASLQLRISMQTSKKR
ncbi:MAG: hypothetical protein ACD_75C00491G0001 [uncultured bacterium]|nr:MAG: hypothetical protein ACD_75C00491G0001 [uncultured bacterium]